MASGPVGDPPITIRLHCARRILLRSQGLDGGWNLPPGLEGAAETVARLGYVQIDTITVIERAHHHVLWTRHPGYTPSMLDELLSRDRRVFEYWTHAAAYIPIRDYRYYLSTMRAFAQRPKTRAWLKANRPLVRRVLDRIRAEGPLRAADFATLKEKRGDWWDWTPTKVALEILFLTGKLMIGERRNFQRVYDLTERVLPPEVDASRPRPREIARFVVGRALDAQGIVTVKEAGWWLEDRERVAAALEELVDDGEAVPVRIEGGDGATHFVRPAALDAIERPAPDSVRLLSPFDNSVIDRARVLRLFGFEYRIECYTPPAKRRFGYFTLPILWGDRLVGRLDPKTDRRKGIFIVRNLVLEPDFRETDALASPLAAAIRRFAAFQSCDDVGIERVEPAGMTPVLERFLMQG
jgi:uncharacterized protein